MNHNFIRSVTFGALMLFGVTMANAQELANLGELLDKGGKRLDAAELKALLTDAKVGGKSMRPPSEFEMTYTSDGKATGRLYRIHPDHPPGMQGTWVVNEQGQLCTDLMTMAYGQIKACTSYYKLNNIYYQAASDDRSAVVRMREIKR